MENLRLRKTASTSVNVTVGKRSREYLTDREVERLIEAAKQNRSGHRDATAILVAYRHGLRASELVALRWDDVDLATGRLHVRRAKSGDASVHPISGRESRALRKEPIRSAGRSRAGAAWTAIASLRLLKDIFAVIAVVSRQPAFPLSSRDALPIWFPVRRVHDKVANYQSVWIVSPEPFGVFQSLRVPRIARIIY
jgi:integrase